MLKDSMLHVKDDALQRALKEPRSSFCRISNSVLMAR
jgi:hypothetical protein